ncbi:MAG: efflux RND transporter periplasmic adaptor subunit [Bacteroidales bacterium]|nr:efflux RND transporter periplasmic adaptor subunit [Bacteroidales bacterium]MBN2699146.1 efflux RND transporter periplasmic adaptor subunit [Bacteroidales bacterium]
MKRITFLMIGILFLTGLFSCANKESKTVGNPVNESAVKKQPVRVVPVQKEEVSITEKLTANINAFEETYLAPSLSGRIRNISVDVNDRVVKGQLLVEMDRTQLEQTRVQYENLKKDLQRMDTLLESGTVTEQSYDQMKTQIEVMEVLLRNLEENTRLRAPYDGIISGKYFNNGELFSPAPNTPSGKAAIVSMVRMDVLKVYVNLSEKYLPEIKRGMKAFLSTDVYPGETFIGTVYRAFPTIDPLTRTFKVELHVPNPLERLRPGMFARVSIELGKKEATVVPAISIVHQTGTNDRYIFINNNGIAKKIFVQSGDRFNDKIEIITDEIRGGEALIIAGQNNLMDGMPVEVVGD